MGDTGRSQRHVQKDLQECLYMNRCGMSWLLCPPPSTCSTMKTPWNTEDNPDDPEPANEADTQMEYCSDWLYSPSTGPEIKYCP
jgi:hypothetical protein